jgi:hypothetical protein
VDQIISGVTTTVTRTTTTETNDTATFTGTLIAVHSTAVTNVGLFDTNGIAANNSTPPAGGNLFTKADFGVLTLNISDSLTIVANVQWS